MPIEKDIDPEEAVTEYLEEGEYLYLLVESAGSNPAVRERLFYESSDLQYIPIYADTDYAPIVKVSPLLVSLERNNEFFEWFIEEGPALRAGIVITSRYDTQVVLQHLQGMIEVKMPDYNFAVFRFHDPTVLDRYISSVDSKAQERLLGPLTAMLWSKQVSGSLKKNKWEWHELFSVRKISDEENMYLNPQPLIQITEEQLQAFEVYGHKELAELLFVSGLIQN